MGGIETAVIHLAGQLHALGHSVTVSTPLEQPPPSQPPYLPLRTLHALRDLDALIAVRDWLPLMMNIPCKKRFFWTGDSFDQIQTLGVGDRRVVARIDGLLAVSAWHAATLAGQSGFPLDKVWVIRNGVHLPYFEGQESRRRARLIYSSTPYRGLALVPKLYQALREKCPDCELHVFSGFEVYGGPQAFGADVRAQFKNLESELKGIPGCQLHGNVLQKDLAREFMKSALLFYPNIFLETSCITAMEAQAAGCAVVTSDLGALKETVGEAGVLIAGRPGSSEYNNAFLEASHRILSDENYFRTLSEAGQRRAKDIFDWRIVAKRFEEYLHKLHGL